MSTQPYTDTLGFVLAQANASKVEKLYVTGAAVAASKELTIFVVPTEGINYFKIRRVSLTFDVAITHAATDGATIQFAYRKADGSTKTTLGTTYSTLTTDAVAYLPIVLNGTTNNANLDLFLPAGYVVTLVITKNGSGVTLPGATATVEGVFVPVIN